MLWKKFKKLKNGCRSPNHIKLVSVWVCDSPDGVYDIGAVVFVMARDVYPRIHLSNSTRMYDK